MREAKTLRIGLSHARQQLAYLIRRAQEGDEVVLTRNGAEVVRLVAVNGELGLKPVVD